MPDDHVGMSDGGVAALSAGDGELTRERGNADLDQVPLCADLDGTLICTDLLHEAAFRYLKLSPFALIHMLWWLLHGRTRLKSELARRVSMRWDLLPYRADLLDYLREQRALGRPIHLVSASPQAWVDQVAAHLGLFSNVTGSDASNNKGRRKAALLVERHGLAGFDYVGDHPADIAVWSSARIAHFAGRRSATLAGRLSGPVPGSHFHDDATSRLRELIRAMRPHQWLKNLLLFASLAAAHQLTNGPALAKVIIAFASFSLIASATYLINDLLDLDTDRAHPRKRNRPFARGSLSIADGVVAVMLLAGAAVGLALFLPPFFLGILGIYTAVTLLYSFRLKRAALADVITLAGLYTLRIIAGTVAAGIPISSWLLAFSMFCFVTLAIAKRCAELTGTQVEPEGKIAGRGYFGADIEVLAGMGGASSFCATLVLCIYTTQPYVQMRYASPSLLWLLCPLLLYVLNRILLLARRGHMTDDPIVFCVRDHITRWLAPVATAIVLAAHLVDLPVELIADI